jgi:hypothetical protein
LEQKNQSLNSDFEWTLVTHSKKLINVTIKHVLGIWVCFIDLGEQLVDSFQKRCLGFVDFLVLFFFLFSKFEEESEVEL